MACTGFRTRSKAWATGLIAMLALAGCGDDQEAATPSSTLETSASEATGGDDTGGDDTGGDDTSGDDTSGDDTGESFTDGDTGGEDSGGGGTTATSTTATSTTTDDGGAAGTTAESGTPPSTPDGTASPPAGEELTAESRARLDGIGPVKMGMTLDEATAAVGREVFVEPSSLIAPGSDTCAFAMVKGGPEGLSFMVNRDGPEAPWSIVRLDVATTDRIATEGGARVGSTEAEVKGIYGDELVTEPHKYRPKGHYLVHDPDGPGGFQLLFETDGRTVGNYRSGLQEAVELVEGCL
ncbi:MAG: hypothetical protein ACRDY7_01120 [Acidimicrobiia bacterium]